MPLLLSPQDLYLVVMLAFVSSVESNAVLAFILSKIAGGIVAMLIAILLSPPYDPENIYEENTILERS